MHATPEGAPLSRAQDGVIPFDMPDLEGLEWMADLWRKSGVLRDMAPLSWQEVAAFCALEGLPASVGRQVMAMSVAYCEGLAMTKPNAMSPMELAEREAHD